MSAADIQLINPNTRTAPLFKNKQDAALMKCIYRRVPILVAEDEAGAEAQNSWGIRFSRLFDMTNDSDHFEKVNPNSDTYAPLFDPKMAQQYNHRAAELRASGHQFRKISKSVSTAAQLQDPTYSPAALYSVISHEVESRLTPWNRGWLLGFKDVTGVTSTAIGVFAIIPRSAVSNKFPLILSDASPIDQLCLLANLNAFTTEFVLRLKFNGLSLNYFYVKQIPVLSPDYTTTPCPWAKKTDVGQWIARRALELTYTACDLESLALDCGYAGPSFRWDRNRRFALRRELDAAFFHFYLGPSDEWGADSPHLCEMFRTPRHAVDYIMETFPIVKRKDVAKYGSYRTKERILAIYDEMAECIAKGTEWVSPLDPPPGDPRAAWTEEEMEMWRAGKGDELIEKYGLLEDADEPDDSDADSDADSESEDPADTEAEAVE